MNEKVRVRIAPSPTGFAHVGTAYIALFNLAFARKNKGDFILRLEDTDQKRNVSETEQPIYDGLRWLGIAYDEGPDVGGKYAPYRQSERLEIYNKHIDRLVKEDKAYKSEGAIFLKVEKRDVEWNDLIRGKVKFPADQMKDLVIRKSDGFPTYMFAVVVDDFEMKITHVIRAEDHISNTFKQISIGNSLGFDIPEYAHAPLIRNTDKSKLSKRKNNVEIGWYKSEGFLPEALVNFLSLLGWSHPREKEIFSSDEFAEMFSLDRVKTTGPVFDINKLRWMNGEYIKKMKLVDFKSKIADFYEEKYDSELVGKVFDLVKERISTLKEFESLADFYFDSKFIVDNLLLSDQDKLHIKSAKLALENIEDWNLDNISNTLMSEIEKQEYKVGKFFMSMRLAITGKKVTPPINESLAILGKDETLRRLSI